MFHKTRDGVKVFYHLRRQKHSGRFTRHADLSQQV